MPARRGEPRPGPYVVPIADPFLRAKGEIGDRELARKAGVSTATTSALCKAARNREEWRISLDKARAIADALDAPVGRLFAHANGDPIGA